MEHRRPGLGARRIRPLPFRLRVLRVLAFLPPLSLGHILIATVVAAITLAAVAPITRMTNGPLGGVADAIIGTAAVVEVQIAFWFFAGPSLGRRLRPRRERGTGGEGIHWVDEPKSGDIDWKE